MFNPFKQMCRCWIDPKYLALPGSTRDTAQLMKANHPIMQILQHIDRPTITKDQIELGVQNSEEFCPVAVHYKEILGSKYKVSVRGDWVYFEDEAGLWWKISLFREMQLAIKRYDETGEFDPLEYRFGPMSVSQLTGELDNKSHYNREEVQKPLVIDSNLREPQLTGD